MLVGEVFATFIGGRRRIVVEQSFVESNAQIDVAEIGNTVSSNSNRLSSGSGCFPEPFSERPVLTLKEFRSGERDIESSL